MAIPLSPSSSVAAAFVAISALSTNALAASDASGGGVRVGFVQGAYDEATADGQKYRLLESDAELSINLDPNAPTCLRMALFAPKEADPNQTVDIVGPGGMLTKVEVGNTALSSPAIAHVDLSRFAAEPIRLVLQSASRVVLPSDPRDVSFGIALPVRAVDEEMCGPESGQM